ncbi:hypothetical protein L602_003800000240 [Cupriavidus gilardii J11]|uniref:DNA-binding MarR family transcriptional regulator n=1 Tax=Cupriavidus gilardii J11 TaxID=936133 RepID=A0A562BAA0_9BURK|nr:hypothetical protein L602_003800000240 [Cupriavidus gilardii J11]
MGRRSWRRLWPHSWPRSWPRPPRAADGPAGPDVPEGSTDTHNGDLRNTMPADLYDTKEPLLRCLQDSLAAWQSALHRILAQSGISPDEWQLLMQLAEQGGVQPGDRLDQASDQRGGAYLVREGGPSSPSRFQQREVDTMLLALSDQGWLEQGPEGGKPPQPAIRPTAKRRLDKLQQAVKALQSAWVAPLSLEERGQMIAYLTRMQRQLDRCAPHIHPMADRRTSDKSLPDNSFPDVASAQDDGGHAGQHYRRGGQTGL